MAELVCLVTHRPEYELGDIIDVFHDGHVYSDSTSLETFLVVSIPDISLEEAREYTSAIEQYNPFSQSTDVISPRRYMLDVNSALDYDEYAMLYVVDWSVPTVSRVHIIDKANS